MLTTEQIINRFTELIKYGGVVFKGKAITAGIGRVISVRISKGVIQAYSYNVSSIGDVDVIYDNKTSAYFCWQSITSDKNKQEPNIYRKRKRRERLKNYPYKVAGLDRLDTLTYEVITGWDNDNNILKNYEGEDSLDIYTVFKIVHDEEDIILLLNREKGLTFIKEGTEKEYIFPVDYKILFSYIYSLGNDRVFTIHRKDIIQDPEPTVSYTFNGTLRNDLIDNNNPLSLIEGHEIHSIYDIDILDFTSVSTDSYAYSSSGNYTYSVSDNFISEEYLLNHSRNIDVATVNTGTPISNNNYTLVFSQNLTDGYDYTLTRTIESIVKIGLYDFNNEDIKNHTTATIHENNYTSSQTATQSTWTREQELISANELGVDQTWAYSQTGYSDDSSFSSTATYSIEETMPDILYSMAGNVYKTEYSSYQSGTKTVTIDTSETRGGYNHTFGILGGTSSYPSIVNWNGSETREDVEQYTTTYSGSLFLPICEGKNNSLFYKVQEIGMTENFSITYSVDETTTASRDFTGLTNFLSSPIILGKLDTFNSYGGGNGTYNTVTNIQRTTIKTVTNSKHYPSFTPYAPTQGLDLIGKDVGYYFYYNGNTYNLDLTNSYFFGIDFELADIVDNSIILDDVQKFIVSGSFNYSYGYNYYSWLNSDKKYPCNYIYTVNENITNDIESSSISVTGYVSVDFDFNNTPAYLFHKEGNTRYLFSVILEELELGFITNNNYGLDYGMQEPFYMKLSINKVEEISYFALEERFNTILVSEDMLHYVLVQCLEERKSEIGLNIDFRDNVIYFNHIVQNNSLTNNSGEWFSNIFTLNLDTLKFEREEVSYPISDLEFKTQLYRDFCVSIKEE